MLTDEQKRELLNQFKKSGLTLPRWRAENAERLNLPHLSTLYNWAEKLGVSTEPGKETEPGGADEPGETSDPPEPTEGAGEPGETGEPGDAGETVGPGVDDGEGEEEDVIALDRVKNLEPSTVPEPKQEKKEEPKGGGGGFELSKPLLIAGGAVILGAGLYLIIRRRAAVAGKPQPQKQAEGRNPFFDGYTTIDQF